MAFLGGIFNREIQQCERNCKNDLVGYPKEVIKACKRACRNEEPPPLSGWDFIERYPEEQRYWDAEGLILTGIDNEAQDNATTLIIGFVFLGLIGFLIYRLFKK